MKSLLGYSLALACATLTTPATAALSGSYGASNFVLELDGQTVGWLSSVEGGNASAKVIIEAPTASPLEKKHLANPHYQDLQLTLKGLPPKSLLSWIQEFLNNQQKLRSGAVIEVDLNGRQLSRLEFSNALLTQIELPGVDGSSKDPVQLALVIAPASSRQVAASGSLPQLSTKTPSLIASNFRFSLSGLENATKYAISLSPLRVSAVSTNPSIGGQRDYKAVSRLSYQPLQLSLGQQALDPVQNWFTDFVVKGNNADDREKTATLEYLSADGKTVLMSLSLSGVGIVELNRDYGSGVRRTTAQLYVEGAGLK